RGLTADEGALVWTALESAAKQAMAASPDTKRFDRVDGLLSIVQAWLRGDAPDRAPVELVVTVPASALVSSPEELAKDPVSGAGTAADGTVLGPDTVQRL